MSKFKLIALDLDGTLLNSKREISRQNLRWIQKAEEAGLIVVFATGRGRESSELFWPAVSPTAPMVMANGAEVWKNHHELLSRYELPPAAVPELIALAKSHAAQYWTLGNCENDELATEGGCLKVGMYHHDLQIISKLRQLVVACGELEVSASAANNVEVNRLGVTKAAGLAEVIPLLGITPDEVVAIGDSINDLSMIEWAGFGVAMKNAAVIVKETADYVTGSNDEDGVAQLIQLILK